MNPYLQATLGPQIEAIRKAAAQAMKGNQARATMAGAFGDARHGVIDMGTIENQIRAEGDATAYGFKNAWDQAMGLRGTDVNRFLDVGKTNAAYNETALGRGLAGSGAALDRAVQGDQAQNANAAALAASGATQRQAQNEELVAQYQEFVRQAQGDQAKLAQASQIISALPHDMQQAITGSTVGQTVGSTTGQQTTAQQSQQAQTSAQQALTAQDVSTAMQGTSAQQQQTAQDVLSAQQTAQQQQNQQQVASQQSTQAQQTGQTSQVGSMTGSTTGQTSQTSTGSTTGQTTQQTNETASQTTEKDIESDSVSKTKGKTKSETDSTTAAEDADPTAQIIGSVAGAATTALLSDRRAKTDIARIGAADNGLGIYRFRYKFDPKGSWHIGFMADEVKAKYPHAVYNSAITGYDMVEYDKATADCNKEAA
jgi:hypothetical protein